MPSRIQKCEQLNRYVLAIFGLLAVMAVSTLVAIRFPYVDMNAQALLDAGNAVVVRESHDSGVDAVGGVGGGGVAHVANVETVDVGVGDSSGGGSAGVEGDILVDDAPAEKSNTDKNQSDGNAETTPIEFENQVSSAVVNGNVEYDSARSEMLSTSENESTTISTGNSNVNTIDDGTNITESEQVNFGGLFSGTELDQLQTLNISASIGGGRKN